MSGPEGRVVLLREAPERAGPAPPPPAAHELGGDEFLFLRRLAVLAEEVSERSHVLLQPAVGRVASIAAEDFGLGLAGHVAVLVGVAEDEFARLQRTARAGRRLVARAPRMIGQLREPVTVTKVVRLARSRTAGVASRSSDESTSITSIAQREFDALICNASRSARSRVKLVWRDGVEVRAGRGFPANGRDDRARVAEDLLARATMPCLNSSGNVCPATPHSTPSCARKTGLSGEAHGHPTAVLGDRGARARAADCTVGRIPPVEPPPTGRGIAKGQELMLPLLPVPGRARCVECRRASSMPHRPRELLHLVEHRGECRLELRAAFLISSALT